MEARNEIKKGQARLNIKNGNVAENARLFTIAKNLLNHITSEITRLENILLFKKGINPRKNKNKEELLGKVTLLRYEHEQLSDLITNIHGNNKAQQLVKWTNQFVDVHIPNIASLLHHKRMSITDQFRNKGLFLGVPTAIGAWVGGLIGAGIGFIIGAILNFTKAGKYFGGQADSQTNWEALLKTHNFSAPKEMDDSNVQQAVYEATQATLPNSCLQSSSGSVVEPSGKKRRGRTTSAEALQTLYTTRAATSIPFSTNPFDSIPPVTAPSSAYTPDSSPTMFSGHLSPLPSAPRPLVNYNDRREYVRQRLKVSR
jgi:hypothetical protein